MSALVGPLGEAERVLASGSGEVRTILNGFVFIDEGRECIARAVAWPGAHTGQRVRVTVTEEG